MLPTSLSGLVGGADLKLKARSLDSSSSRRSRARIEERSAH